MNDLQTLQLHDFHLSNSAKLVPFAGWEMPVSLAELMSIGRRGAGLLTPAIWGNDSRPGRRAFFDFMLTNSVFAQ